MPKVPPDCGFCRTEGDAVSIPSPDSPFGRTGWLAIRPAPEKTPRAACEQWTGDYDSESERAAGCPIKPHTFRRFQSRLPSKRACCQECGSTASEPSLLTDVPTVRITHVAARPSLAFWPVCSRSHRCPRCPALVGVHEEDASPGFDTCHGHVSSPTHDVCSCSHLSFSKAEWRFSVFRN
jgi:hypothetical protein